MYHGISAYNRSTQIYELISRAEKLGSVSACYADRPIGPIGIYCDIDHAERVDYIADRDVFSYISETGSRKIERTSHTDDADIWYPQDGDDIYSLYCEYSRKADKVDRYRKYAEISAVAVPSAIWVDCSFGFRWVKAARVIARRLGLIVMFVKSVR